MRFKSLHVPRGHLVADQIAALQSFRDGLSTGGLLGDYASPIDLAQKVQQAIDFDVASTPWTAKPLGSADRSVKWRLAHRVGDTYIAENIGEGTAFNARLSAHADLRITHQDQEPQTVPPGEALSFMAATFMGLQDDRVQVTWHEEGTEEDKTWKYPLPARPSRR